jgi:hypothetical protein
VSAVVIGLQRNASDAVVGWRCDVEEENRKRIGGKKRLYASAGRVGRQ